MRSANASSDVGWSKPITGIAGCCARAASGHAAAAPPSATINSRRPMVTVIRPSRARCVNGTIPRHERAVLTFEEGRMLVASTSIVGFGFKSGKAQNERMFFRFAPRKRTYLPTLELLPPPALGERRHGGGLARRGVAVRRRAIFVASGTLTDWTPRAGGGCPRSLAHPAAG